jgi:hypothetical protein
VTDEDDKWTRNYMLGLLIAGCSTVGFALLTGGLIWWAYR